MIYLDNAATSFPKPPWVYEAANGYMRAVGASPGRAAHRRAVEAGRIVVDARERLASLFAVADASRIVFTLNATEALNLAIAGSLKKGDRVVISSFEHNSVVRPLRFLEKSREVAVCIVPCGKNGEFDPEPWEAELKKGAALAVVNHGSNVTGAIVPLEKLGALCRKYGTRFCVDAAQTAGLVPIDVERDAIDFLAFSGHKGLYGLQGTGGLYIREGLYPLPLKTGGTGSDSESEEQPDFLPDRYESGTQNGPGIASLGAGVAFVMEQGVSAIYEHGSKLTEALLTGLAAMPEVRIHGPKAPGATLPIVSVTFARHDSGSVAQRLNDEYDIAVRVGLHCAPLAHRAIGTFPGGTLRISFGYFNSEADVAALLSALKTICG
jgi:cysteine desulfurase / selenocysteine lyase